MFTLAGICGTWEINLPMTNIFAESACYWKIHQLWKEAQTLEMVSEDYAKSVVETVQKSIKSKEV